MLASNPLRSRRLQATFAAAAALCLALACGGSDDPAASADPVTTPDEGAGGADAGAGGATGDTPAPEAGPPAAPADTWASFAGGFMEMYCVSCHPNNPLSDRDYQDYAAVFPDGDKIRCGVSRVQLDDCAAGMPAANQFPIRDGAKPSDEERDRLVAWIEAGMPE